MRPASWAAAGLQELTEVVLAKEAGDDARADESVPSSTCYYLLELLHAARLKRMLRANAMSLTLSLQQDLFPAPLLCVSAAGDLEQLPTKPQPLLCISVPDDLEKLPPKPHELPTNPEEVQAIVSPAEDHSDNNKPEEQSDEDEVATMEETDSQFSLYAARQYRRWLKYLT